MATESDLYSDLTGDAGVSAVVGSRVYPGVLPDTASYPAIAYRVISATVIGGVCKARRVQVDVYAQTYSDVKDGRDAVEALADGKAAWQYLEGPDLYEEDTKLYHQAIDLVIS